MYISGREAGYAIDRPSQGYVFRDIVGSRFLSARLRQPFTKRGANDRPVHLGQITPRAPFQAIPLDPSRQRIRFRR